MSKPLHGIRVLDLSRLLPGPYCTMFFADFGAEVIKVEEPNVGDYSRWEEPKVETDSAIFSSLNRNKKSVCINLKSQEGKEMFLELVKTSDVLVESFRPGVMDRLGLGYDTLSELNPKLIYCAITGYGQTGPYAQLPGHDINYLSYAGLLGLQGESGQKPALSATQIADIGGGSLMAAIGILVAIVNREKNNGKGQFVDISMMDGVLSWLQTVLPNYLADHKRPERGKLTLSGGKACYQVYETADQRYIAVGALEHKFWKGFCEGLDRPDLIDDLEAPKDRQEQMKVEISGLMKKRSLDEWMTIFEDLDTCVTPVLHVDEIEGNPQVKEREMIKSFRVSSGNELKQLGIPIKLSDTPGDVYADAPKLGEHNREILEDLGFSVEQINNIGNL
ncbi:CaiB/BaiF CoA transferase family protein [Desertibacillus haloalkaliphilus]|uniref:CaiB/BaiF CoA transferase family protein n=1 Tax=Desertibacillus haloalkaliphilus TaxID=1328930 RepID=UPI001C2791FF|nr:CaiB/BaiF CoA-transferase family protein [Desertibacillus haloalkaliphilus]MBU8906261.1 CoA transferase [Desertibacillus haloalkaliphilus]